MASLGESDLMIGSWIGGRVRVLNIFPDGALYPRMGITLGVVLNDLTGRQSGGGDGPAFEWRGVSGELRLSEHGAAVGLIRQHERSRILRPSPYHNEHHLRIVCELDPWRLEVIERHRSGSSPRFWIELWPTLIAEGSHLEGSVRAFSFDVPREQWLEFVSKVAGSQFDVLEIQYTAREAERFQRAIARTREARAQINNGEYDSAVAECRKVIEALTHELKEEGADDPLRVLFETRTDARRAKEYQGIISRIKQLSGFVHHDFGAPLTYSRAEAQFVLRTTESVLALIGALSTPKQ